MLDIDPYLTLPIFGIFIYLVLIVVTIRQRGIHDAVARWLSAYLTISLALEIGNLLLASNQISSIPEMVYPHLGLYGNLIRAIFLLHLSVLFFRRVTDWFWLGLGFFSLTVIILLEYSWFSSPFIIKLSSNWIITGISMIEAGLITSWGILMFRTIWRTIRAYRQGPIIISKPRISYWSIGLILVLLGDIFAVLNFGLYGGSGKILGTVIVSYIVLTTRLPDIKGVFKHLTSIFIGALLELSIYTVGIVLFLIFFGNFLGFQPVISGLIFGLLLLIILNPLIRLFKKWLHKLFFGEKLDFDQILSDFAQNISHALDLNSLSSVIVDTISNWIDVETGTLFTVDSDITGNTQRRYQIINVQKASGETQSPGFLSLDSPITHRFTQDQKTLTNSEIEGSPEFQSAGVGEYTWFRNQRMEVYIPIHGMGDWIGLLALGTKSSEAPYTESDIRLLEKLGDLIAIGLQNARLVESVVRVNNEFRRAYSAMDDAHAKLERMDQTKSDFISIASHELRTPLTVVSGYSQMLSEDPIYNENDFYKKVIQGINDGTKRLYEIVDSMLDVAKIDTRALELNNETVDIENLIQSNYTEFRDAIRQRNLIFTFYDLKNFPQVIGDPEALNKVFYHLFSNAIKYTPDGGKISVSGSIISEDDDRFIGNGIEIVISDTGIGIDPRFKELIFSKFYQTGELVLHSAGKTKFKGGGPGLGLAIVRGIVQAHGGRVWAESTGYDEQNLPGSQFHIILPTDPNVNLN
jgi:signal transduction histidine kinase